MAFFVTLPWTCLCSVASALARTIKVLINQNRVIDLEQGIENSTQQDNSQRGPLANVFAADVYITVRRTITTISRSIYHPKRPKISDSDVEKGNADAEPPVRRSSVCTVAIKPQLVHQTISDCQTWTMINDKGNATDSSSNHDNVSPSPSLSISSIIDLMPIPVTTPEQRALVAAIVAARQTSPSPPNTPSLLSPGADSSHDSSFTPLTVDEPTMSSPTQAMRSTPFLEQQSTFLDSQGHVLHPIDESEEYGVSIFREVRDPWMGKAGFTFPVKHPQSGKKRNVVHLIPPFSIVEEAGYEEGMESLSCQASSPACDSPWDDGINENHGLKGRAFWRHTMQVMKLSDPMDDQLWVNNGLQVVN